MSASTLEDLMQSVNTFKSGAEAATQEILGITGKQKELAEASTQTLRSAAVDDSTVTAAAQAAALRTQTARVSAANSFHTNINDVGEQINKYAEMADSAQQAKDESLAEIARKDSVTIFDDPLEYIMNRFTINGDIAKHNSANAMLESANARIESMNKNTQTTIQTQNAITESITAASAEAATRLAASKAMIDADKMAREGLQYNLSGIQAVQNASKEELNNAFSLANAKKAEEGQKIALAHLALSQREFAQRQKEYAERDKDKDDQAAYAQSLVNNVNRGRQARGVQPLDDLTGKMLLAALKGNRPLSNQMQIDLDNGERSTLAGVNMLGATPAQAAVTLSSLPVKLAPAQEAVKNLLSNSAVTVNDAIHATTPVKGTPPELAALAGSKDKEQINTALNRVAQGRLNAYAKNINIGDDTNPYNIGSLNVLASNSSKIQSLPVYQKVLRPLADQGVDISDPSKVIDWVGDAVAKGTITHSQAINAATIFQEGVRTNLATRNFTGFGLVPTQSYNASVQVDPSAFMSKSQTVDMTQPDAISKVLIAKQSIALRNSMFIGSSTGVPGLGVSGAIDTRPDLHAKQTYSVGVNSMPYSLMTQEERDNVIPPFFTKKPIKP